MEEAALMVPMPDGTESPIANLACNVVKKTLGVCTSPDGSGMASVKKMRKKANKWIEAAAGGNWNRQMFWTSIERQFWPSVSYGLCCSTACWKHWRQH